MDDDDDTGSDEGNTSEDTSEDNEAQMIPKERLDAVLGKLRGLEGDISKVRETNANLQGQLDAGQKPVQARVYSPVELAQAVTNGEIDQSEADTIRDQQLEDRVATRVEETIKNMTAATTRASLVSGDMAKYREAYPDIAVSGTELHARAEEEYAYLTNLGHPADLGTELVAVRAVLGPVSRIGKVKKATPLREPDEQGGSGGDNPPNEGDKKVKLSADEKAYYTPMVGKGKMYPSWDDVHAEMKHSSLRMREKMQRLA